MSNKPEERAYRLLNKQEDLSFFQVLIKETDMDIGVIRKKLTPELVKKVNNKVLEYRQQLEDYIQKDNGFIAAMSPYTPREGAPEIAVQMARQSSKAGVGPMAAVAGAFSEFTGRFIKSYSNEIIVENGGDIYLKSSIERAIGIYAGNSPLSNKIALKIKPYQTPLGICTSSGKVGHSVSKGKADAVIILAPSAPLADATATAAGNMIKEPGDVKKAVDFALSIEGITGGIAIKEDKLSAAGDVELVPL